MYFFLIGKFFLRFYMPLFIVHVTNQSLKIKMLYLPRLRGLTGSDRFINAGTMLLINCSCWYSKRKFKYTSRPFSSPSVGTRAAARWRLSRLFTPAVSASRSEYSITPTRTNTSKRCRRNSSESSIPLELVKPRAPSISTTSFVSVSRLSSLSFLSNCGIDSALGSIKIGRSKWFLNLLEFCVC